MPFAPWLLLGSLLAQQPAAPVEPMAPAGPAAKAAPAPAPRPAREVRGRLEDLGGLVLLRVWGSPADRGYAHGFLLGGEVARVGIAEFSARFGSKPAMLQLARDSVERLIEYPDDVRQQIDALYAGLVDSGADLQMKALGRAFDRKDLLVANALDVFGLMGCSGFSVWGDKVQGGGVLTARNFDWPFTGPHMLDGTILCVEHLPGGAAVCSVTWPGYVGTVTGVSSAGVAAFLHVGSAKISLLPEPGSWPTATAARRILEELRPADPPAAFRLARELLGNTSPPAGFLTRVVLPIVPASGSPAAVFETDRDRSEQGNPPTPAEVVTNHFLSRKDGIPARADSLQRERQLRSGIDACFADGDHLVAVDEAWRVLERVQRGNKRFGTLHSLVFRHEPWCFELRLGEPGENGCVPAPVSSKRFPLTREQVFGKVDPAAK